MVTKIYMVKSAAGANKCGLMEPYMKENGMMIADTAWESSIMPMGTSTRVIGKMTRQMALVCTRMKMAPAT